MIDLRPARSGDADDIAAIFNGTVGTVANCVDEPTSASTWREAVDQAADPFGILVVPGPEGLRGWVQLKPWTFRPQRPHTAELALYVAEGARITGVAAALLVGAIVRAADAGLSTVVAVVLADNTPSVRGLMAAGFTEAVRLERVATVGGVERDICWLTLHLADGVPPRVARYAARHRHQEVHV